MNRRNAHARGWAVCAASALWITGPALADQPGGPNPSLGDATSFSLATGSAALASSLMQDEGTSSSETTTITTYESHESWDLGGPYFLRSADPQEAGEVELKFIGGYETASDGTDDDAEFEFELEWGMTEDIELLFSVPVEMGDGEVQGNADITWGFHTRFWKEDGWIPAVAMRNQMRIPNGDDSSGVDYIGRLLVTKSIVPGRFRAHLNPFLKSVNGHNEEDARHFQWGVAAGVDYLVSDSLVLIFDYLHRNSEEEGSRNNHALEFGADWKLAEHHTVAFGAELGLDGDSSGANFGARISYILSLAAPRLDRG